MINAIQFFNRLTALLYTYNLYLNRQSQMLQLTPQVSNCNVIKTILKYHFAVSLFYLCIDMVFNKLNWLYKNKE